MGKSKSPRRTRVYRVLAGIRAERFYMFERRDENMLDFLRQQMAEGEVRFQYYKVEDGTAREARGTLRAELLPPHAEDTTRRERERARNSYVLTYWDLDRHGWRSARRDHIVGYYESAEMEE